MITQEKMPLILVLISGEKKNLAYLPFASQEMHFVQIQYILKTECCTMNSTNGFVK